MSQSAHEGTPIERLIARLRYWQVKKLALDAARPDFTADQLRELNAAESRLLACDPDELEAALHGAPKGVMPSVSNEMHLQRLVGGNPQADLPGASAEGGVTHPPTNTSALRKQRKHTCGSCRERKVCKWSYEVGKGRRVWYCRDCMEYLTF